MGFQLDGVAYRDEREWTKAVLVAFGAELGTYRFDVEGAADDAIALGGIDRLSGEQLTALIEDRAGGPLLEGAGR